MTISTKENNFMAYRYVNEDQIDPELNCTICNEPFQYPVNCVQCGQTFCQECIDRWRQQHNSCPSCRENECSFTPVISRIVINQLNRLLVQCTLCQQTNIQRGNFADHISYICPKKLIICNKKCGWKGFRENYQQHLSTCRGKSAKWLRFIQRLRYFSCTS